MSDFIESIIDWEKFDATVDLSIRTKTVTKELIEQEVELWQKHLTLLNPLDVKKVKSEVNSWDISAPNVHNFDEVAATYSKLMSYKIRISQLLSDVNDWTNTCDDAIKHLEDLAPGAYSGTAADKKSSAKNIVLPFVHLRNKTYSLQNFLDKMHSSILFCAQQLDYLIKEKQSRAKMNLKLSHEGDLTLANQVTETEDGQIFRYSKSKKF